MKKYLFLFLVFFLFSCEQKAQEKAQDAPLEPINEVLFNQQSHSFVLANLNDKCESAEKFNCAIDTFIKCSMNPKLKICNKKFLPRFIFMQDEGLERPSEQTYNVISAKKIDANTYQVKTKATCNGRLFGLCNGNVIYILLNNKSQWFVQDLYAVN